MERINKFYDIGEISDIMRLDVKSVNQLFIVNVAQKKYLLKIYIPRFYKTELLSLTAQELVSENLRMAPRVIYNKKNSLLSMDNNKFFSLQECINGSEFILNEKLIDVYLNAASNLYELLNNSLMPIINKNVIEKLEKDTILNRIRNAREQYKELGNNQNHTYNRLLNVREKLATKLLKINYSVIYQTIIHGDIRPSNVICDSGAINFIDFDYITYGDYIYELTSSIALLSNYREEVCRVFWDRYTEAHHIQLGFVEAYMHLMSYYLKSNFPLNIMKYESKDQIEKMSEERIRLLEFCYRIVSS